MSDDIEVIHMTAVEWDQALTNSLNDLGLTWEELTEQAKTGDFSSLKARQLWLMAGGQGPNQADLEVERLRADVRAAYAEREEMWERKAAALRERDEARRELDDLHEQRAQLKMKLAKSEDVRREQQAKLHEIAMAKVWTNEDGKRFVFADDLAAILRPATVTT